MKNPTLKQYNRREYLKLIISANPEWSIKFTVGFTRGIFAASEFRDNPEKLPTTSKFFLECESQYASGFRSAFIQYNSVAARDSLLERFQQILCTY